jgi:hypothetical protein
MHSLRVRWEMALVGVLLVVMMRLVVLPLGGRPW